MDQSFLCLTHWKQDGGEWSGVSQYASGMLIPKKERRGVYMRLAKKIGAVVLAAALSTALSAPAFAVESDELEGHYAGPAIERWAGYDVINGYDDGLYHPDNAMNRAELSGFMSNLMKLDVTNKDSGFTDVSEGDWFAGSAAACKRGGIINGYGDGSIFAPYEVATREQAMAVLANAMGIQPAADASALDKFNDKGSVSDWAATTLAALVERGIVNGIGGVSIAGQANITRGEMMCMLDNAIKEYIDKDGTYSVDVDGIVLVAAKNVTLNGTVDGDVVVAHGMSGAKVSMGAATAGVLTVQANDAAITNVPVGTAVKVGAKAEGVTINDASTVPGIETKVSEQGIVVPDNNPVNTDRACRGQDTPGLATLEESVNQNRIQSAATEKSTAPTIAQDTVPYLHTSDYGKSVDLQVEILTPSTAKAGVTPLLVWVNGGGFTRSDAAGNLDMRLAFAKAGYVVASVQHRVGATSNFPAPLQDIKAAIRFLKANNQTYKFDKNKVVVGGNSSGGYYASMVGVTSNLDTIKWPDRSGKIVDTKLDVGANLNESSAVNAVVDFYGVSDLTIIGAGLSEALEKSHHSAATTEAILLNGAAAAQKGVGVFDDSMIPKTSAASPFSYISENTPPFIMFHGTADTLVSPVATKMLQNRLNEAGVYTERYVIEGGGHGGGAFMQQVTYDRAIKFLNTYAGMTNTKPAKTDLSKGTKTYAATDVPSMADATAGAEKIAIDPNKWTINQVRDVAYKVSSSNNSYSTLKMNLIMPSKAGDKSPRPVLFCAACGGFNKSNPNAMSYLRYAERGYIVAVAEIRVVPTVTMPVPVQDGKAAIRWLRAHAGAYNIDPNCIIATGNSAGGYMGVMLGVLSNTTQYSDDIKFDVGDNLEYSSAVQGVVDLYGVSDLTIIGAGLPNYDVHDSESNTEALWVNGTAFGPNPGGSVFDDLDKTAIYSPFTYLDSSDPAFLMFHGTSDVIVSPISTMEIYKRCQTIGVPAERYTFVDVGHGGWQMSTAKANKLIDNFMDGIVASMK